MSQVDFSNRATLAGVDPLFNTRWSPRYFRQVAMDDQCLLRMLEAARFSPSCYNEQPWRFYLSNDASFERYLECLVEANQAWARNASVLGFLVAKRHFAKTGKANQFASFDCGAAWMSLALQAHKEGWHAHGMGGINTEAVYQLLGVDPDTDEVLMGFALGKLGDLSQADAATREKEVPNQRKALEQIYQRGL